MEVNAFHKDFSEILGLMTNLTENETKNDISIDYIREINSKFDQILRDMDSYKSKLKQNILDNFNNVETSIPVAKKQKVKGKKKKQNENRANKLKDAKQQQISLTENTFKNNEAEKTNLEKASCSLNKSMGTIISKISTVEAMTDQIKNKPLSEIISIEDTLKLKGYNRYFLTLNKNYGNDIDLRWDRVDQSSKVEVIPDTQDKGLKINSNSCYNWFRTDIWFQNEDFEVLFMVQFPNSSNNSFYIGVINESVKYTSSCMCCSIKDATYFSRGGKVSNSSGGKSNLQELDYTSLNEVFIRVRILMSSEEVYFGVEERELKGPFQCPVGDKLKVIAGACGKATEIRLDIIKSLKI